MANNLKARTNGCTFQWKIGNITHCWLNSVERIDSPCFVADVLRSTKWSLRLYPMEQERNEVLMYVQREENCIAIDNIDVNFQLSLLDKDGNILTEKTTYGLRFGQNSFSPCIVFKRERMFFTEREAFLPEDTLTVQCTLWEKDETLIKSKHIYARTVFKVNILSFIWKIDEFSSFKPGVSNKFKNDLIDFDIVLNGALNFEKNLILKLISFHESIKYFSFKTSIKNSEGRNEDCGKHEYFADDLKKKYSTTLLFIQKIMENKSKYLPDDVLSLEFEYSYSTGSILYQFCSHGMISPKVTQIAIKEEKKHSVEQQNIQLAPVLANDLKSMYDDGIFSDMEMRTSTKIFPVHKNILSARSSVFRRMFSHDMKENNSGHVDITDLDDDTIHRMLLYVYTDCLDDLQLDNACKLYVAAEKYEILSMRNRCSTFLKDNLIASKACDILVLADIHQDDDLKSAVVNFILRCDKEVFGSAEWKNFMDTNSKLAANVMYRKVFPE